MIVAYHRPKELSEALRLLARENTVTVPLGGGTVLSQIQKADVEVVDLQNLGLNRIVVEGQLLKIGATVTLQSLLESSAIASPGLRALQESLLHEAGKNIRQMATLGGALASGDGRSPFLTAILALDPRLVWAPEVPPEALGDYLPLRALARKDRIITELRAPTNAVLRFSTVARSPMDVPVVCAAVATWPSGRTRVTLGGHGLAPILAMDGPEPAGAVEAAREAYRFAADEWASAAYRMDVAGSLVRRMLIEGRREGVSI